MAFVLERFDNPRRDKRADREAAAMFNPRSPRYRRTRSTPRQQRLEARRQRECLCPRSLQIGGGQCGYCGRFTHREACRNRTGWWADRRLNNRTARNHVTCGQTRDSRARWTPPREHAR